jgi:hypothetical protein
MYNKLRKRKNLQRYNKADSLDLREYQLWLLSILVILTLTLSILATNLLKILTGGEDYIEGGMSLHFYMSSLALLILLFTLYLILKQREIRRLRAVLSNEERHARELEQHMKVMTSLFEISTDITINRQMKLSDILQLIVKRVTECLEADYSSLLLA